jgi:hypothetical protein
MYTSRFARRCDDTMPGNGHECEAHATAAIRDRLFITTRDWTGSRLPTGSVSSSGFFTIPRDVKRKIPVKLVARQGFAPSDESLT